MVVASEGGIECERMVEGKARKWTQACRQLSSRIWWLREIQWRSRLQAGLYPLFFFRISDDDLRRWVVGLLTSKIIERVKERTISNYAHEASSRHAWAIHSSSSQLKLTNHPTRTQRIDQPFFLEVAVGSWSPGWDKSEWQSRSGPKVSGRLCLIISGLHKALSSSVSTSPLGESKPEHFHTSWRSTIKVR